MKDKRLNPEVTERICKHMNKDHQDSLISYAVHYGNFKTIVKVKMLSLSQSEMILEVDGAILNIPFDHQLIDSEDAHKTLIKMLKSMPKGSK